MNVARGSIVGLLIQHQCKKFGEYEGHEIWITPKKEMIRLPLGCSYVHSDLLEIILIDILEMGIWEIDYWMGQNGIN